jgi:hypothetical protein
MWESIFVLPLYCGTKQIFMLVLKVAFLFCKATSHRVCLNGVEYHCSENSSTVFELVTIQTQN